MTLNGSIRCKLFCRSFIYLLKIIINLNKNILWQYLFKQKLLLDL